MGKLLIPVKFLGDPADFQSAVNELATTQEGHAGVFNFGVTFDVEDPQQALISATVQDEPTARKLADSLVTDLRGSGLDLESEPKPQILMSPSRG